MPLTTTLTTVTTAAQALISGIPHRLGEKQIRYDATDGRGLQEWVFVFNDEAATDFGIGDVIARLPASTTEKMYGGLLAAITNAVAAHSILGVAQHVIPFGGYGWILCRGQGLVKCGTGNITADAPIVSGGSAAGKAKTGTIGTDDGCFFGYALEAEATDNTTFDAYINTPGVPAGRN